MPTMTYNSADGSYDYDESDGNVSENAQADGPISDPSRPAPYGDDELDAARTAAVEYFKAQGGPIPEQQELDKMFDESNRLKAKANEVSGYNADKSPRYVLGELERAQLLRKARGIDDSMADNQTILSRAVAQRYLEKRDAQAVTRQSANDTAAAEKRAREIVIEREANRIADGIEAQNRRSNGSGGSRPEGMLRE